MYAFSSLSCSIPRFEAALEGEPPSSRCPHCVEAVFGPGWWCDNCNNCAFPGMILDADHQTGRAPALAPEGGGGVEQLLGGRRIGQGEAEGARPLQGEVQILLVQFDAEAGVEGAFD